MDLDPGNLLLFARVIECGSFSAAAERVGLPKSTVSRRISALERQLGERLLLRTTRKLSLTDFGHHLLVHARQVAEETDAAASLVLHRQARPSGRLRVSMPTDSPGVDLPRLLSEFLMRYPDVTLDLDLSARRVDLVGENVDLAMRMGDLPDDSSLVARRLFTHGWGLYAAPSYLALRGTPRKPADLLQHDGLALRTRLGEPLPWQLERGDERWSGVAPPRALANSPRMVAALAVQGLGVAAIPHQIARQLIEEAACTSRKRNPADVLVRVLPGWRMPSTPGWAVMPGRRLLPEKTRVFVEMLEAALRPFDVKDAGEGQGPAY